MLIALFFIVGAVLAYNYRDIILPIFTAPLNGQKLIYLTPGGGFTFALLISVYAGLAVAFPILLQQLYSFLSPALPEKARRKSAIILISSLFLLVAGILFGYFVAVPSALTFLYGFADQYVTSALTADSYTNFVVAYTIGIGIVFQVPLLLLLLHTIKPLKPGGLMKSEKWVVLGAFIVAAILTPTPDPINQTIMAGPVIVVYQLGVIAVLISIASNAQKIKRLRIWNNWSHRGHRSIYRTRCSGPPCLRGIRPASLISHTLQHKRESRRSLFCVVTPRAISANATREPLAYPLHCPRYTAHARSTFSAYPDGAAVRFRS